MLKRTVIYSNIHNVKDFSNKIHELFLLDAELKKKKNSIKEGFIVRIHMESEFSDRYSQNGIGCVEIGI